MTTPKTTDSEFLRRYRERLSAEKMFVDLQRSDSAQEIRSVVVDMHQDGLGLWTDHPLEAGDRVSVSVAVKTAFVLNLESEVKHVNEIRPGLWQIGVEFFKAHPSYQEGRDTLRRMENLSLEMQMAEFYEDTAVDMVRVDR